MKNIARFISVAATVCGLSLWAQDDDVEDDATTTTETTADGGEEADVGIDIGGQIHHSKSEPKFFYTLPKVEKLEGSASVLKPGARDWERTRWKAGSTRSARSSAPLALRRASPSRLAGTAASSSRARRRLERAGRVSTSSPGRFSSRAAR